MKWLVISVLLLVAALVDFGMRGQPMLARTDEARTALASRMSRVRDLRRDRPLVGEAQLAATASQRDALAALGARRFERLTHADNAATTPALPLLLDNARVEGLAANDDVRQQIESMAARSARMRSTFERVLDAVVRSGIPHLEALELVGNGQAVPVPGLPGLERLELRLVANGALPQVLACLESLVPGATRPTLVVRAATLHRIEPERWSLLPLSAMDGPPVRLALTLHAIFPAATATASPAEGR